MALRLILFLIAATAHLVAEDDFQSWQWLTADIYTTGNFTAKLFGESRWRDDSSNLSLALGGAYLDYKLFSHTTLELGAFYMECQPPPRGNQETISQFWLDPTIINKFKLADWVTLDLRNMLEMRWIENYDDMVPISRNRIGFVFPMKNLGPIKAFYMNQEFFYDCDVGRFNENRLVPGGVVFRINEYADISLFYMWRSIDKVYTWNDEHILGTHIQVRF